jgi:hypothetical protein
MMGRVDKDAFEAIMKVLFSGILSRILIQYIMIFLWVPVIVAAAHAAFLMSGARAHVEVLLNSPSLQRTLTQVWSPIRFALSLHVPDSVVDAAETVAIEMQRIPSETWNILPSVLLSMNLCLSLVPWTIMKIMDKHRVENSDKKKQKQQPKAGLGRPSSPFEKHGDMTKEVRRAKYPN